MDDATVKQVQQTIEHVLGKYFTLNDIEFLGTTEDLIRFRIIINSFTFIIDYSTSETTQRYFHNDSSWRVEIKHQNIIECWSGSDIDLDQALAKAMNYYANFYNETIINASNLYNNYFK